MSCRVRNGDGRLAIWLVGIGQNLPAALEKNLPGTGHPRTVPPEREASHTAALKVVTVVNSKSAIPAR